jgi:hypothetical protein
MPLKHGTSHEVITSNIKELIRAGHPQRQAVAAALAHSKKSKKMAQGGLAEEEFASPENNTTPEPRNGESGTEEHFNDHMDGNMAPNAPEETRRSIHEQSYQDDTDRNDKRNSRGYQTESTHDARDHVENPRDMDEDQSLAEAIEAASRSDRMNFDQGGTAPSPSPSPVPLDAAQSSMRKAFHFAKGGEVPTGKRLVDPEYPIELSERNYRGRDNTKDQPEQPESESSIYSKMSSDPGTKRGYTQEEYDDEVNGNKNDTPWVNASTEQPMSSMPRKPSHADMPPSQPGNNLHPDVMNVIMERKKKRNYR